MKRPLFPASVLVCLSWQIWIQQLQYERFHFVVHPIDICSCAPSSLHKCFIQIEATWPKLVDICWCIFRVLCFIHTLYSVILYYYINHTVLLVLCTKTEFVGLIIDLLILYPATWERLYLLWALDLKKELQFNRTVKASWNTRQIKICTLMKLIIIIISQCIHYLCSCDETFVARIKWKDHGRVDMHVNVSILDKKILKRIKWSYIKRLIYKVELVRSWRAAFLCPQHPVHYGYKRGDILLQHSPPSLSKAVIYPLLCRFCLSFEI